MYENPSIQKLVVDYGMQGPLTMFYFIGMIRQAE